MPKNIEELRGKVNMIKKKIIKICVLTLTLLVSLIHPAACLRVSAEENTSPIILIEKYTVTNDKIVPGNDFIITLYLKNYSMNVDAENVLVSISYPEGVAPEYGSVAQCLVETLKGGETKKIDFPFNAYVTLNKENIDFFVSASTGLSSNNVTLRIPCGSDSPFSIQGTAVPASAKANEKIDTSLTFKVLGTENVSNVSVEVLSNGIVLSSSYIGIVTPGVTKTQLTSIVFDEVGEYYLDLRLRYTDSSGLSQNILVTSKEISITENGEAAVEPDNDYKEQLQKDKSANNNLMIMGISGILIILICVIIVFITSRKKR